MPVKMRWLVVFDDGHREEIHAEHFKDLLRQLDELIQQYQRPLDLLYRMGGSRP